MHEMTRGPEDLAGLVGDGLAGGSVLLLKGRGSSRYPFVSNRDPMCLESVNPHALRAESSPHWVKR